MFGIDKYFNDILVGIAVGNSSSKYRSSSTFFSDTRIINSSLYSTPGRKKYIDLALSYADAKTDCNDTFNITSYDVNSSMESFYIGGGYSLVFQTAIEAICEISFFIPPTNKMIIKDQVLLPRMSTHFQLHLNYYQRV